MSVYVNYVKYYALNVMWLVVVFHLAPIYSYTNSLYFKGFILDFFY